MFIRNTLCWAIYVTCFICTYPTSALSYDVSTLESIALENMGDMDLCISYGKYIWQEPIEGVDSANPNLTTIFKKELKKRKLVVRVNKVKGDASEIGSNECEMFAKVRLHPTDVNNTHVGACHKFCV